MKLALAAVLVSSAVAVDGAAPGAEGLGDRLFPALGNGGYDARSYDVAFEFQPGTTKMRSSVTMQATATQALSRFNLDSVGQEIAAVEVNGKPAAFRTHDEELVITPAAPIGARQWFTTTVRYTADRAQEPDSAAFPSLPDLKVHNWIETPDGFALFGQPDRAHLFYPSNDHPSDKALFTFRVTVPKGLTAVANGRLAEQIDDENRTTFVYRGSRPMATHVSQVAVGDFDIQEAQGSVPLRSAVPKDKAAELKPFVDRTKGQVDVVAERIGRPYPFDSYGVLALNSDYNGVALESQTMSTFSAASGSRPESVVPLHELVHQYFGNSVSVKAWEDMWLSEGHAYLYEAPSNPQGLYERDQESRDLHGPAARPKTPTDIMFFTNEPGALVLSALRQQVGEAKFREIETTFLDRFRDRSASTRDYIDTVNQVTGRDLTQFMNDWLYGAKTPPMPGHPEWVTR